MLVLLFLCGLASTDAREQLQAKEIAAYRLTEPVFKQFAHASRLIKAATRADSQFARDPLFTPEISVSGDAAEMAAALQARLEGHPGLVAALFAADLDAREYTKFALALLGARLADGFVTAGVLRSVPPGVAADNVAFVHAHQPEVAAVLRDMGIEEP